MKNVDSDQINETSTSNLTNFNILRKTATIRYNCKNLTIFYNSVTSEVVQNCEKFVDLE